MIGKRWQVLAILVLLGLAFAYGIFDRQRDLSGTFGLWNVVLDVVCSPQFLTYIVMPLWLASTWFACQRVVQFSRLLRHGSRVLALRATTRELVVTFGIGSLTVLVGTLLSGSGLPVQAAPDENGAAQAYFELGVPPSLALLYRLLLVGALLMAISATTICLQIALESWTLNVLFGLAAFAWIAVSANGWINGWADIAASVDPARVIDGSPPVSLAAFLVVALIGTTSVTVLGRRRRKQ